MENLNNISQLLNEVKTISDSYDRVAEATGENFNIFSILQVESDEVRTHSRFIAELLNPNGSHAQKDKFLKIFINQFADDFEIDSAKCKVFVEYYIGGVTIDSGGRLDILIKEENSKKVLMIENKVYAGEQQNQLLRYHKQFPDGKLFFLSRFGNESAEKSSENITYKSISYEKDIIKWLEECKKEAVAVPILRETISQYINLIKKLTNQNLNKKMSQDIINRVLIDKDSFDSFQALVNSKNEVQKFIIQNDLFRILGSLKIDDLELEFNKEDFLVARWRGFSFTNEKLKSLNVKISFLFNSSKFNTFIFGFYKENTKDFGFNYNKIKKEFGEVFNGKIQDSPDWPCYKEYSNYSDWEILSTLRKVRFGDFEEDLKVKINSMLEIANSIN